MANEKHLIYKEDLIAEYDRVHIGPPGGARKLIEDAPTVDAVEIPDCNKCAFKDGIAYWHQCENCLGQARNNFVSISEVNKDG